MAPIKIADGDSYCSNCGTKLTSSMRRMTDVSVRRVPRTPATPVGPAVTAPASATIAPVTSPQIATPAPQPRPAAAALHSRTKTAHTLDLRAKATGQPQAQTRPAQAQIESRPVVKHADYHTPVAQPSTATHERHIGHVSERLDRAKQISRSPHVHRFADNARHLGLQPQAAQLPAATVATGQMPASQPNSSSPQAAHHHVQHTSRVPAAATPALPNHVATQHEAMARLAHTAAASAAAKDAATQPERPRSSSNWRPHLSLSPNANRVLATTAAVGIMAGYVWLQNYPKLALQSASSRAGLTATLPGYVPSSYNLVRTDTQPGLITLNFTSPSVPDTLKISQTRTDWDSRSLLDNFVAKNTDDYTTVHSEGLTIYLFNNNQAAWVNHGIRYTIEGAARLSREQILKIAYSL